MSACRTLALAFVFGDVLRLVAAALIVGFCFAVLALCFEPRDEVPVLPPGIFVADFLA